MKELLLQARVDACCSAPLPADLCRWIEALAASPVCDGETGGPKLFHTPAPGVLEVWIPDTASPSVLPVTRYHRLSFCPQPPEADSVSDDATFPLSVAVEVLPPCAVYTGAPLARMGLLGVSPGLVTLDGQVLECSSLTAVQMGCLHRAYAVLTPALASCLGIPRRDVWDGAGEEPPCGALWREVERLLPLCFPGGGEATGCPLHLALCPSDVPASRLLQVGDEYRTLCFGASVRGSNPREAFPRYGAFRSGRFRVLEVTMLYPDGELESARSLFDCLVAMTPLLGMMPTGDVKRWVSYDASCHAADVLVSALYGMPPVGAPATCRLCCLLVPSGGKGGRFLDLHLSVRLQRILRFLNCFYWGPIPLHAIGSGAFARRLPAVASRLLLQMGGMPWVPLRFASQATDLIAGFSCLPPSREGEPFCAVTFYNDPSRFCCHDLCRPSHRFADFFRLHFRRAYADFFASHADTPPRRLVVYCHRHLPLAHLLSFVEWMGGFQEAIPVVLVQVRRTSGSLPRHYDPDAPGSLPPAGTCVYNADGSALLFCRDSVPSASGRGIFHPGPLEVFPRLLCPDGNLLPLSREEADEVLIQACQLVWADPQCPDGSPLPLVLSHADHLVRLHYREWQAEMVERDAIRRRSDDVAM